MTHLRIVGVIERRQPLPPGRYWITVTSSDSAPDRMTHFLQWTAANAQTVIVDKTEPMGGGVNGIFCIFTVLQKTTWDAKQFGFPQRGRAGDPNERRHGPTSAEAHGRRNDLRSARGLVQHASGQARADRGAGVPARKESQQMSNPTDKKILSLALVALAVALLAKSRTSGRGRVAVHRARPPAPRRVVRRAPIRPRAAPARAAAPKEAPEAPEPLEATAPAEESAPAEDEGNE
jgi:hypothetical protein